MIRKVTIIFLLLLAAGFSNAQQRTPELWRQVEIIRTAYGVPHIRAENLRAAGYALAWLQCEDYGPTVTPMSILQESGRRASVEGAEFVEPDFFILRHRERTLKNYGLLSRDVREVYEGFAVGEKEGFHSTTLKVRQEAEVALAAKIAGLEKIMAHLFEPIAEQDTQIEKSLVELVRHMTRQVIQRELVMDSSQIEHVMREALKLLPLGVDNVRLYINPQDFEQVKALRERHEETWRIVEDESLLPGGCRVETEHSRIDATIETRVTQVMVKLFDQLHDQALHPAAPDLSLELPSDEKPAVVPELDVPDAP